MFNCLYVGDNISHTFDKCESYIVFKILSLIGSDIIFEPYAMRWTYNALYTNLSHILTYQRVTEVLNFSNLRAFLSK